MYKHYRYKFNFFFKMRPVVFSFIYIYQGELMFEENVTIFLIMYCYHHSINVLFHVPSFALTSIKMRCIRQTSRYLCACAQEKEITDFK